MTPDEVIAKRRGAATWLAEQGFAIVHIRAGHKDPTGLRWEQRAVTDPGMAGALIKSDRDQFGAFPRRGSRLLVIDQDKPGTLEQLGVELPETLRVQTSVKDALSGWRGQHVYLRLAPGITEDEVPRTWEGGEVRLAGSGQVVGPWSLHPSGLTYEPLNGARSIGLASRELVNALRASKERKRQREDSAKGPADPGWFIEIGRHEHLVTKGRKLRGDGLTGERLLEELVRLDRDRHHPPLADVDGRGIAEIKDISAWLMREIADDPPPVRIITASPSASSETLSSEGDVPSGGKKPPAFRTAREVVAETPEHVRWLLAGYVALGCLHEFVGKAKAAGKTTWLLRLIAAVLDGRPFLGHATVQGPVVFLTEQPGPSLRSALVRSGLGQREDISVLTWRDAHDTPWRDVVAVAIAECERIEAVLLVVDTLPAFAGIHGDAENDAGAALEAIAPLQAAASEERAVIVVRHERKMGGEVGDSARGSSAFTGAVDVVLRLARKPDAPRPTIRSLSALSRFDETPDEVMIELTEHGYISLGNARDIALTEARACVLRLLDEAEGDMTRKELEEKAKEAIDAKPTTVQAAYTELLKAEAIERSGTGKRGDPYRYRRLVRMFPPPLRVRASEESNSGTPDDSPDLTSEAERIFADDLPT